MFIRLTKADGNQETILIPVERVLMCKQSGAQVWSTNLWLKQSSSVIHVKEDIGTIENMLRKTNSVKLITVYADEKIVLIPIKNICLVTATEKSRSQIFLYGVPQLSITADKSIEEIESELKYQATDKLS